MMQAVVTTAPLSAEAVLAACTGWRASIETLVLTLPWFVSAGIFAIGQVYGSTLIQMFSCYLLLGHYTMVAINGSINETYADPNCPVNVMLGGLSHVTFYAGSIVVFVLWFHCFKRHYPGYMRSFMLVVLLAIPLSLIWLGVRTPASVAVTLVVTLFTTSAFFAFVAGFSDEPQWLARTGVVEMLHYTNYDLLLTSDQKKQLELDRVVTAQVTKFCETRYKQYLAGHHQPQQERDVVSFSRAVTVFS